MKKTNTRSRKQGRNKFSPIDCMSDTFVLEKRELLAGGAPPAVIFKFSGTFSERYGLMNEKIVQDESWQSELSENVSINKSNVILETAIISQKKVIGSVFICRWFRN